MADTMIGERTRPWFPCLVVKQQIAAYLVRERRVNQGAYLCTELFLVVGSDKCGKVLNDSIIECVLSFEGILLTLSATGT